MGLCVFSSPVNIYCPKLSKGGYNNFWELHWYKKVCGEYARKICTDLQNNLCCEYKRKLMKVKLVYIIIYIKKCDIMLHIASNWNLLKYSLKYMIY